jgi:hypothetical protein
LSNFNTLIQFNFKKVPKIIKNSKLCGIWVCWRRSHVFVCLQFPFLFVQLLEIRDIILYLKWIRARWSRGFKSKACQTWLRDIFHFCASSIRKVIFVGRFRCWISQNIKNICEGSYEKLWRRPTRFFKNQLLSFISYCGHLKQLFLKIFW